MRRKGLLERADYNDEPAESKPPVVTADGTTSPVRRRGRCRLSGAGRRLPPRARRHKS